MLGLTAPEARARLIATIQDNPWQPCADSDRKYRSTRKVGYYRHLQFAWQSLLLAALLLIPHGVILLILGQSSLTSQETLIDMSILLFLGGWNFWVVLRNDDLVLSGRTRRLKKLLEHLQDCQLVSFERFIVSL
jgi:hypothetical protein